MTIQKNASFWHTAITPLWMLAPMEDVTDTVFRQMVLDKCQPGGLHVLFTEFTPVDGMCHPVGFAKVKHRLEVSGAEYALLQANGVKLVAQIWGNKPEKFYQTAQYIAQHCKIDGIDINMGCPARNVVGHGSCSALIDQPALAAEIIQATREASALPLSVKTRIGFKSVATERWIGHLLQQPLDALVVHGRIQKQMSEGLADWGEIAKAVKLRNTLGAHVKIIGNGDVHTLSEAAAKVKQFGVDGVMIGRGIFKNPWLFGTETSIAQSQKIEALIHHIEVFDQVWGNTKNFALLKRFFKIYLQEFEGASALRHQLMQANSATEALEKVALYRAGALAQSILGSTPEGE